ncbi:RNA-binding domain-containing protein [Paracidovorax oryzae]|uniref:RNA-binding domain-containing protein n=1 Tax=Paracidovorax oryzae TaxID=862720 RepID=UPI0002F39792|nr:RNA-binding domain-containing protein [Paracidovorax oryzae]
MSYSDAQLLALLAEPESLVLERKESFDKDKVCKTVCAFANDLARNRQPGVLFIGVRDDGTVVGVQADDRLRLSIDQITSDARIQPLPSVTVRVLSVNGLSVVAIVVHPSALPPVRFDGRAWVRMSASNRQAHREDERVLDEVRRTNAGRPFDSEAIPSASVDDLDLRYFKETYLPSALAPDVLAANGRSTEEQLATTRMALGIAPCLPTVTGLLTLGLSPQDFLAGAYVQFIRYAGTEQGSDIEDQEKITGTLETMILETERRLKAHIRTSLRILGVDREVAAPDYPLAALQQLFRNAVLHRTYEGTNAPVRVYWFDDRIEIWNPGGPYGIVTPENFGEPYITDYRNPSIAEVLAHLDFVQRFGFGIQSARKVLQDNGNPPPEFRVEQGFVLVTVRKGPTA